MPQKYMAASPPTTNNVGKVSQSQHDTNEGPQRPAETVHRNRTRIKQVLLLNLWLKISITEAWSCASARILADASDRCCPLTAKLPTACQPSVAAGGSSNEKAACGSA